MNKNIKKRSRHQYSHDDDKIQQEDQQYDDQEQQEVQLCPQKKKNKTTQKSRKKQEQRVDPDVARRLAPSKKRNEINKEELSEIQYQLNKISQQLERDLIRSVRLLKLKEAHGRKKKEKEKEKNTEK